MLQGTAGYSGYVKSSSGSGPSTGGFTPFKYTAGAVGGPTVGLNTFTIPGLAGGSGLVTTVVNNGNETEGVDYTVDYGTGEMTRNNAWVLNDTLAGAYKPA